MAAAVNYYKKVSDRVYPGAVSMALAHRTIFKVCLAAAVVAMNGPITGAHINHNGFAFFVGPILGPVAAALILTAFPFRPYRGAPFAPDGYRKLNTLDPRDAALISVFRSNGIKQFLWISALKLTLILELIMGVISLFFLNSLNWSLSMPIQAVFGLIVTSYLALGSRLMDYGFRAYAETQAYSHD